MRTAARVGAAIAALGLAATTGVASAEPAATPAKASDFNGDGHSDLAVGGFGTWVGWMEMAGTVVVIDGSQGRLDPRKTTVINQSSEFMSEEPRIWEEFGRTIGSGDFNGDGYADLSVSSQESFTYPRSGSLFLLFGSPAGLAEAVELPSPGEGKFGRRQTVGDFDNDGFADIFASMSGTNLPLGYVIYGNAELSEPGQADFAAVHADAAGFTAWDPGAGDVDGDGYDDLVVPRVNGTRSEVLLFRGGPNGLPERRSQRLAGGGMRTAVGDLDNDGHDDVAFGDSNVGVNGKFHAGQVKVWYGAKTGMDAKRGMTKITAATARIPGEPGVESRFGDDVAIGDVNGNGRAELAIGVPFEDIGTQSATGRAIVLYGDAKGIVPATARIESFTQNSPGVQSDYANGKFFGSKLAFGDYTGDGRSELLVKAGDFSGSVTVLNASAGGLTGVGSQMYTAKNTGIESRVPSFGEGLNK
ncbi:FG-GAP repeat domain-containing protein [Tenggerimyces flavus]|uniref:FG-GAP repeat domain-containing protein n=1 Tax=Tenggerimyces flavus TaxID=1708749 RepID=A0ABV7YJF2_9ACTN|nr:VCBS repeat-containing protein [Tenggerimyces flavus]MBM7787494.1 hypothetical protein [Tenggerimyces flavus]